MGLAPVTLIDTAGLEPGDQGLTSRMRQQTEAAIAQADLVLFLIDARAGVVAADEIFAELVRSSGKPVILAANKCEGRAAEPGIYEAYALGLGEPLPISAEHGIGIGELSEAIQQFCPDRGDAAQDQGLADDEVSAASLAHRHRGQAECRQVDPRQRAARRRAHDHGARGRHYARRDRRRACNGTDRSLLLFDTAGLRRKMRVEGRAEELSVGDALKAIRFAEVVVLLLDVEHPFEKQDLQIAELIAEEGRALVIAVNKWDLVREREKRLAELRETCQRLLPQVKGVALVPVSAMTGKGLDRLMQAILAADALWNRRLPTHALNQWLQAAVEAHPPPAVSGRRIKLRYITQANARPPTFVLFCSRPKALPESYSRYLVNALRESFDMPGVPIRLNLRKGDNPFA